MQDNAHHRLNKPNESQFLWALTILVGFGVTIGLWGLDFGRHWDEIKLLNSVENAFENNHFLPNWYHYPSVVFSFGM